MNSAFRAMIIAGVLLSLPATAPSVRAQQFADGAATQMSPAEAQNGNSTASVSAFGDSSEPVRIRSAFAETWQLGDSAIHALRGGQGVGGLAELQHGGVSLSAENLVVFDTAGADGHLIRVYAEGRVLYESHGQWRHLTTHSMELTSAGPSEISSDYRTTGDPQSEPSALVRRAIARFSPTRDAGIVQTALQVGPDTFAPPQFSTVPEGATPLSRRVQIRPRSSQPLHVESSRSTDTIPEEQVFVISGGVNVLIEGLQMDIGGRPIQPGLVDLSADQVVIWTQPNESVGLEPGQTLVQPASTRFQVYLEGNILVRMNQNTITASHAFFDANNDRAMLLNAELRAYIPQTGGEVRVRAERLRQVSADRFHAQNGWTTTSPYGRPGYRLQASDIFVEPGPISPFTPLDPNTGLPLRGNPLWVTALNSQLMVGDVPVLRLPKVSAPAEDPHIPLRRFVVEQDRIFGLQAKTVWNLSKLLGQPAQPGSQWDLLADVLSQRGPGIGIEGTYDRQNSLGRMNGSSNIYYQYDSGTDVLGRDRRSVAPEDSSRGGVIWRHRQTLPGDALLFGEIGFLSDRNYWESFHERRFDTEKD
ncbi:MAG: hypothetical protein KDA89_15195, partial [Planctomycetaceae bacterium]|nr:hypothetical protein [Planctomycetaceae bacterium]